MNILRRRIDPVFLIFLALLLFDSIRRYSGPVEWFMTVSYTHLIFGKTLYDMVAEQMQSKLSGMPDHIRIKVQKSLQKICDEGKEYFICIVI